MPSRLSRVLLIVMFVAGLVPAAPAAAQEAQAGPTLMPGCYFIPAPAGGGALQYVLICVPAVWNQELVVFAHGYVPDVPQNPWDYLLQLGLPDGSFLPAALLQLGYAFAAPSYRVNGLAVLPAVQDIQALVLAFPGLLGQVRPDLLPNVQPARVYLTGASEGGLITTRLLEDPAASQLFAGGLAACGPIGSFRKQVTYWGDFRVLYDYFFPGLPALRGQPIPPDTTPNPYIPPELMLGWDTGTETDFESLVRAAVLANPAAARQLIRTSGAAVDPADVTATTVKTTLNLLWYNVFATMDGQLKLGGNPFDNSRRWYFGSSNDWRLNQLVGRYSADAPALTALLPYETTGRLTRPLVTLHTLGDEIVPFWHELLYFGKRQPSGNGQFLPIPIARYGHCNFTGAEVQAAFGILVWRVTGQMPVLPAEAVQAQSQMGVAEFSTIYIPLVSQAAP